METKEEKEVSPSSDSTPPSEEIEKITIRVDGGLVAWLQVLGAFCLAFTTW